ncbi:MAG: hypothetical protein WKG01_18690 [Kofleriaceae bacterium]
MRNFLVTLMVLALSSVASAEDIVAYEAEGDADAGGADPRVTALDEAFGRAVASALVDLLDADTRKANKAVLDRELIVRARLWVAKFAVAKDVTEDGRRHLTVTVRIDRDRLRAKLGELGVGSAGDPPSTSPGGASAGTCPTVVLLRVSEPDGIRADYGASAEKDIPGLGALSAALRAGGMTIKRAPASGPEARAAGELPLSDDEAEALAGEAKAEIAAIAGVTVGAPVAARGVASSVVLVSAHVRLIARGRKLVGHGSAAIPARGTEPAVIKAAIDRALVAALGDVVPPSKPQLGQPTGFHGDDTPVGEAGIVLVRLSPKTPWGLVAAELKYLSGAKGISRATLRRLSPGGWVIGVATTESVQRIAQIANKPPATDTSAQVKVVGDIVELGLSP